MMPMETRSKAKKPGMEKPQDKGHSSPKPERNPPRRSAPTVRNRKKTKDEIQEGGQKDKMLGGSCKDETSQKMENEDSSLDCTDGEADYLSSEEESLEDLSDRRGTTKTEMDLQSDDKRNKMYSVTEKTYMYKGAKAVVAKAVVAVVFVIVLACMCMFMYMYMYMHVSKPMSDLQPEFQQGMLQMKSFFPSQEQHFWDMVESTVDDHLDHGSNPKGPIVLLFGSKPDGADTTKCLAKKLGNSLSETLSVNPPNIVLIDGRGFENMNADEAKLKLDERLEGGFKHGQKVAVILNLDALPPCSILLFHSYCENDYARYKDAALIFTVTLDNKHQEVSRSKPLNLKGEEAFQISEHLTKVWTNKCIQLSEEKVEAMLSRVANNVGIVKADKVVSC